MKTTLLFICLLFATSAFAQTSPTFEIEGHRGARGCCPKTRFRLLRSLEYGVKTIELDVVVSRDNKLVVSHEPWFSSVISLDAKGNQIPADKQKGT
jgi:glycerophosphoryl diester phosphodiesterase